MKKWVNIDRAPYFFGALAGAEAAARAAVMT
jgi:hypothetical protein